MNLMFIGYPPWGNTLFKYLKTLDENAYSFVNEYLTFHLGSDKSWKKVEDGISLLKNTEIANKILNNFEFQNIDL